MKRLLLLLLLLAFPAQAQYIQVQPTPGEPAPDWTSSMDAVWLFNESSGTRANESATTAGSDCDLSSVSNTPVQQSDSREGGYSIELDAADNDGVSRGSSACADGHLDTTADFSFGGWVKPTGDPNTENDFIRNLSTDGAMIFLWGPNDFLYCRVDSDSAYNAASTTAFSAYPASWTHFACTYDATGDELKMYYNGTNEATTGSVVTPSSNGTTLEIGKIGGVGADFDGYIDEVFWYSGVLTSAEVNRILACGVNGKRCRCNGTAYVNAGRALDLGISTSAMGDCNATL